MPSDFHGSDKGSIEHDNAYDATENLLDHVGSRDGRTLAAAHTCSGRGPSHCEPEALTTSSGVFFNGDVLPKGLSTVAEETEDSLRLEVGDERTKRLRHMLTRGRRGRARVRDLVRLAERMPTKAKRRSSVTRRMLPLPCASSALEAACQRAEAPELDRLLMQFMNLQCSEGHQGWKGEKLLASVLFFFLIFSQLDGDRLARSLWALKGWKEASPSFSIRPLPDSSEIGLTLTL